MKNYLLIVDLFKKRFNLILRALVSCPHSCLCEGVRSPGTVVTNSCELPCWCWELNSGPLGRQPVFLTTEPLLQPQNRFFCLFLFFVCFCFILFFETGFLCSFGACPGTSSCRPGWPRTHRDLPASASLVLGVKKCITTAQRSCHP